MKTYKFIFNGRQSGAIGIFYKITDQYKANSLGEALFMLWTDYEHITIIEAYEGREEVKTNNVELIECEVPKRTKNIKTGDYTI